MQVPEPGPEHRWLERMVGEWTCESECSMGPDQPPMTTRGTEVVRSLGGLWMVNEMEMPGPDGAPMHSVMTLGFDPAKGRFVGSFIASCMTHMWPYNGTLDASGKVLTLDSEGPAFSGEGMSKYQDIVELLDDDTRELRSQVRNADGTWTAFMKMTSRRKA